MCDQRTRPGWPCTKPSQFMVYVSVQPTTDSEISAAAAGKDVGRMVNVCAVHLVQAVHELYRLPVRRHGAAVQVRPVKV